MLNVYSVNIGTDYYRANSLTRLNINYRDNITKITVRYKPRGYTVKTGRSKCGYEVRTDLSLIRDGTKEESCVKHMHFCCNCYVKYKII